MHKVLLSAVFTILWCKTNSAINTSEFDGDVKCPPCFCYDTRTDMIADCSSKGLTSIPQSLPKNISRLNLASNYIFNVSNTLRQYKSLRLLNISFNRLTGFQKNDFVSLNELLILDLRNNHLKLSTATYPQGLFQHQQHLQVLLLHKNSVTEGSDVHYPDKTFKDLVSLQTLQMDGLRGCVLDEGFSDLHKLTSLSFNGYCSIRNLTVETFRYVPNIRFLDISNCKIIHIDKSTFEHLQVIHTLNISNNVDLGTSKLGRGLYGLQNSTIKILKANNLHRNHGMGVLLRKKDIQYLKHTKLEELHFRGNRLELLEPEVPIIMPRTLQTVDISYNMLIYGMYTLTLSSMVELRRVDASFQTKSHISPFLYTVDEPNTEDCSNNKDVQTSPTSSMLINNYFQNNSVSGMFGNLTIFVPQNVQYFDLSFSKLSFSIPEIAFGPNKLKFLNLSHNFFNSWHGPVGGLTSLESGDLSNNFCDFVSDSFFSVLTSLKILNISNNFLGYAFTNNTFQNPNLTFLDISENKINNLPLAVFQYTSSLQSLSISHNYLTTWNTKIGHLINLTLLDLSYNLLEDIPLSLRRDIDKISNPRLVIRLEHNPFICSCDTLPSLKWLDKSGRSMINIEKLSCKMGHTNASLNVLHDIVLELEKECASYVGVMVGIASFLLLLLCLILAGLVYRYRWKLRYVYYLTLNRHKGHIPLTEEQRDQFEFDAFISYADEDRGLVINDMRRILEDEEGLRLCIHHRDFLAGEAIAANILNAIASSRKTVAILSRNFLRSYWCKYEIEMAKMEGIQTGRDTLLIVMLEDVPVKDLSSDIVMKMKEDSYIEYTEEPEGQVVFWQNLKRAIC